MKVGDLVKRRPVWGEWVERNPWMISEKDLEEALEGIDECLFNEPEKDNENFDSFSNMDTAYHSNFRDELSQ